MKEMQVHSPQQQRYDRYCSNVNKATTSAAEQSHPTCSQLQCDQDSSLSRDRASLNIKHLSPATQTSINPSKPRRSIPSSLLCLAHRGLFCTGNCFSTNPRSRYFPGAQAAGNLSVHPPGKPVTSALAGLAGATPQLIGDCLGPFCLTQKSHQGLSEREHLQCMNCMSVHKVSKQNSPNIHLLIIACDHPKGVASHLSHRHRLRAESPSILPSDRIQLSTYLFSTLSALLPQHLVLLWWLSDRIS